MDPDHRFHFRLGLRTAVVVGHAATDHHLSDQQSVPHPELHEEGKDWPLYPFGHSTYGDICRLLKPYGSEDFNRTAEKVYRHWQLLQSHDSAAGHGEKNVLYLKVHLVSGESFLTHMTFRQISESLPDNFIQIHRSYIVNMKHVTSAERTLVILDDNTRLPVSESKKAALLQYMNSGR